MWFKRRCWCQLCVNGDCDIGPNPQPVLFSMARDKMQADCLKESARKQSLIYLIYQSLEKVFKSENPHSSATATKAEAGRMKLPRLRRVLASNIPYISLHGVMLLLSDDQEREKEG